MQAFTVHRGRVAPMVYRHALVCEYAHARLVKLAGGQYPRDTEVAFD